MKILNAFRRLDDRLLRTKPVLWVLGVHIYIPLVILISIVLFCIGAGYSLNPLPRWGDYKDFYASLNLIMTLPTIMLTILFIIRQVKFNSKRIHTSLPYKYSFSTFLYYFLVMAFITALPMAGNLGAFMRTELELNVKEYREDRKVIDHGYAHLYLSKTPVDNGEVYDYDPQYHDPRKYSLYRFNKSGDSIVFYRRHVGGYYGGGRVDTVSVSQAIQEIRDFKRVAEKYGARFDNKDEQSLIRENCYAPKVFLRNSRESNVAYNHIGDSEKFHSALNFNEHYDTNDGPYFVLEIDFWRFYLLIALGLAVLLIILCSVKIADFGWAMLITALQPTVFGILFALIMFTLPNFHNDEEAIAFILMIIFTVFAVFVAFFSNFKTTFRKAYAICLHVYIPFIVMLFIGLVRELRDCCSKNYVQAHCDCVELLGHRQFENLLFATAIISTVIGVWAFGKFYRKIYINPQMR